MIITRFAPSPTGFVHIGNIRTAIISWLFAKHNKGKFIVRIEDTDMNRLNKKSKKNILKSLYWLGINYEEGPFFQIKRINRYRNIISKMLQFGLAYFCYSDFTELDLMRKSAIMKKKKPKYNCKWRPESQKKFEAKLNYNLKPAIRFKNPKNGIVNLNDSISGKMNFNNVELDDLIVVRNDGFPTYNFCASIDDFDMYITHVIRGNDHINNTPRQINILKSIFKKSLKYIHIPIILNVDKKKISKRTLDNNIVNYYNLGYLPGAIINYLGMCVFGNNNEIFNIKELIKFFKIDKINKSSFQWNLKKLNWINSKQIKKYDNHVLYNMIVSNIINKNDENYRKCIFYFIKLFKYRSKNLNEILKNFMILYHINFIQNPNLIDFYLNENIRKSLINFKINLINIRFEKNDFSLLLNKILFKYNLNINQFLINLRLIIFSQKNTPDIKYLFKILNKKKIFKKLSFLKN